jgi:hypothetical protein
MPGEKRGWGSGLPQPLVLSESLRQRILAALDYADDEAPPPEHGPPQQAGAPPEAEVAAGRPVSAFLPRRVPGANNGPKPPAHIARPAMLASFGHPRPAEPFTEPQAVPAPRLPADAQRAPAEQRSGQPDHRDAKTASSEQEESEQEEKASPAPRPQPVPPPERARRGRGFKVMVAVALVLALAGSLAFLLKRQGRTVQAIAPTTGASASAVPGTPAEVRAAAAAWVASQVSRAQPISCDPQMCQALRADGVPAADLLVLRPDGSAPLHSRVIVVTPAVTTMVGTKLLTSDAPAALASFGSGSRQVSVRMIYSQGAAAYAAALRQDMAERKTSEIALLENPRVTAALGARRQLRDGQIDPRLLLTLAQLASQWPLSIVAFGDRAPGASPGVPLRSADLAVAGDAAGRARQMAVYAHQLRDLFASARIRAVRLASGQDVVQVGFAAPSPFGVLNR